MSLQECGPTFNPGNIAILPKHPHMNSPKIINTLSKGNKKYFLFMALVLMALAPFACHSVWKIGKVFVNREKTKTYTLDTLNGQFGITRTGYDSATHSSISHFFKMTAKHDQWIELDTTGAHLLLASAFANKNWLIFTEKLNSSSCNPCEVKDSAFEVSAPSGK
jgi:hypothetical protein